MNKAILEKVIKIISKSINIKQELLNKNSCASDFYEWDSLAQIKIILSINKEFNIKIKTSQISNLNSVSKIVSLLDSQ
jgi:acyl carrier protein